MIEQIPLLEVRHLRQYFGKQEFRAVDDISFSIHKGEVFGLVGESGCGKTTTGRSIIRLYTSTGGEIFFKGRRISAGLRDYTDAISSEKELCRRRCSEYRKTGRRKLIAPEKRRFETFAAEQRAALKRAVHDNRYCNSDYRHDQCREIKNSTLSSAEKRSALFREKKRDFSTGIQMIFQDPVSSLDPRMTVREIIAEGLRIRGIRDESYITEQVCILLEKVGLPCQYADRYPHEFSGGQRQRIGIARALIVEPELIIADEPVSSLDVSIQAQVINLLGDLRKEMGLTILFIAHDLSVVKYFSDRIAVMYAGKLVELASSDELFAHPLHPYTRSLLSAVPQPDPRYEKTRKRIVYNASAETMYTGEQVQMREVTGGHFVRCSISEFAKYHAMV
jgi:oligopeptide transport system ATP-binding protein